MNPNELAKTLKVVQPTQIAAPPATLKGLMSQADIKKRFEEILKDKAAGFISSVINTVQRSEYLQKCTPHSVLGAAVVAAALDLPIDPNLGLAYIIPYKDQAQFQLGYKGFIQLAQRTGQYKTINACEVYEGELKRRNRFTGEIEFDEDSRTSDTVIGYVAYFRLLNGFEKYIYMTKEELERHAATYSRSYGDPIGRWKKDFHSMAIKTVLKRLISKYGILSIEMHKAIVSDQAVLDSAGENPTQVDATWEYTDKKPADEAKPTETNTETI